MHTRAVYDNFSHFLRTDSQNLVRQIFFKEFSDTLWIENVFKPIRAIICTDSEVIWNVYMFNWDQSISLPAAGTVKKIFSHGALLSIFPKFIYFETKRSVSKKPFDELLQKRFFWYVYDNSFLILKIGGNAFQILFSALVNIYNT